MERCLHAVQVDRHNERDRRGREGERESTFLQSCLYKIFTPTSTLIKLHTTYEVT